LLDGGHVHIRLSVVCLENGDPGQRIRVESKDPHQTFIAEVVDGGVLRGSL
jgi:flagella basal body P-ring formation protein FlgA